MRDDDWLQDYILEAISQNVCTNVGCTTCGGASNFRQGVWRQAAKASGQEEQGKAGIILARVVARSLARIQPDGGCSYKFVEAVRLILCDIWGRLGGETADREIEGPLCNSWAGETLAGMKAHSLARDEERRRNDAVQAAEQEHARQRRQERSQERRVQHAMRMEAQREYNRIWHEQNDKQQNDHSQETN